VAVTKFVRTNFDLFEDQAVIRQWAACLPLWDAPEDSDVVFQLLADILEAGKGPLMGSDWLSYSVQTVLMGHVNDQMKPETDARLWRYFTAISKEPEMSADFEAILNQLSGNHVKRKALEQCLQTTSLLFAQQPVGEVDS
jgi:hypothetical protein